MINKKKGVSAVVATVLIIMITVAAVAIIWSTVIPMIKNSASEGLKCFDAETSLAIVEGAYTCANSTFSRVQISRGSGDVDITGVVINWIKDGNSVTQVNRTAPGANGYSVYFNTTVLGGNADEVTIAPIIAVGDVEMNCTAAMPITLPEC